MAKQAVGPVIKYLDKGILILAGGAFLYLLATYGVMSPNTLSAPTGGESFGPGEVDQQLKVKAIALTEKLRAHQPESTEAVKVDVNQLQQAADPLALAKVDPEIPRPVPFLPVVPMIVGGPRAKHDLVPTVALGQPQVFAGRSGMLQVTPTTLSQSSSEPSATDILVDVNWVTIVARFDIAQQERAFRDAGYNPKQRRAALIGVELQRRQITGVGSAGEWELLSRTLMPLAPPPPPELSVVKAETEGDYTFAQEGMKQAALDYVELISRRVHQVHLMRPLFPPTTYGDPCPLPPMSDPTVAQMDFDYGVQQREYCMSGSDSGNRDRDDPPALDFEDLIAEAGKALDADDFDRARKLAQQAQNEARSSRDEDEVSKLKADIDQAEQAFMNRKTRTPVQLVWAHDAVRGSVRSGYTYQYRARPVVLNNYFGLPSLLNNPVDAEIPTLPPAQWSPPSDPITAPESTRIFVRNSREDRQEVRIDVFKWFRGQWLRKQFKVQPGAQIGEQDTVQVPPGGQREPVDFSTQARVVTIDFDRSYRERSRNRPDLGKRETTTAVVYIDAQGRLRERLEGIDEVDPDYLRLKSIYYRD